MMKRRAAMASHILLCVLMLAMFNCGSCLQPKKIQIAVLLTESSVRWSFLAVETRAVADIWRSWAESQGGFGETGVFPELMYLDVGGSNPEVAALAAKNLASGVTTGEPVHFFLAPYSCALTEAVALALKPYPATLVSGGAASESVFGCFPPLPADCVSSNSRRFEHLWGSQTPAMQYTASFVSLMRLVGARSIAVVAENGTLTLSVAAGLRRQANNFQIPLVYDKVVPLLNSATDVAEHMLQTVNDLDAIRPDAFVGSVYEEACFKFIELAKARKLELKAALMISCIGHADTPERVGDAANFFMGAVQWHADLQGDDYTELPYHTVRMFEMFPGVNIPSPKLFKNALVPRLGRPPSATAASVLAALYMLHTGIALANSTDQAAVKDAMDRTLTQSFFGVLTSSRFGSNKDKDMVVIQIDKDGQEHIVMPLHSAKVNAIYPIPKWNEREYSPEMYGTTVEKAICTVVCILMGGTCALIGYLTKHRHSAVVKSTSFVFSVVTLIGCIFTYAAVLVFPLENNSATCNGQPWMSAIGFNLILSSLIATEGRIDMIFNQKRVQHVQLPNSKLAGFLAFLLAPTVLFSIIGNAVGGASVVMRVPDTNRPAFNYMECSWNEAAVRVHYLSFAYLMLELLCIVVLAYRIRSVDDTYNHARALAMAAYTVTFSIILITLLELSVSGARTERYVIRSTSIIALVLSVELILYWPTVNRIRELQDTVSTVAGTGATPAAVTKHASTGKGSSALYNVSSLVGSQANVRGLRLSAGNGSRVPSRGPSRAPSRPVSRPPSRPVSRPHSRHPSGGGGGGGGGVGGGAGVACTPPNPALAGSRRAPEPIYAPDAFTSLLSSEMTTEPDSSLPAPKIKAGARLEEEASPALGPAVNAEVGPGAEMGIAAKPEEDESDIIRVTPANESGEQKQQHHQQAEHGRSIMHADRDHERSGIGEWPERDSDEQSAAPRRPELPELSMPAEPCAPSPASLSAHRADPSPSPQLLQQQQQHQRPLQPRQLGHGVVVRAVPVLPRPSPRQQQQRRRQLRHSDPQRLPVSANPSPLSVSSRLNAHQPAPLQITRRPPVSNSPSAQLVELSPAAARVEFDRSLRSQATMREPMPRH